MNNARNCDRLFSESLASQYIIITLGFIEVWFDSQHECYLNEPLNFVRLYRNDAKLRDHFAERFLYRLLSFNEAYAATHDIFLLIQRHAPPQTRVILTVSPVGLAGTFTGKDIMVANMYSKSVLRAVAEEICVRFEFVDYFPGYESVMLSPRNTTWEPDGYHVGDAAVAANVRWMVEAYLEPSPRNMISE